MMPARFETRPESNNRFLKLDLIPSIQKPTSYIGSGCFKFLNRECDLGFPIRWEVPDCSKLWKYQLHYFDYLHQPGMGEEGGLDLMKDWIRGHLPQKGAIGWEPYPTSLRLVNWIKFLSRLPQVPHEIIQSLNLQARNLARQIEYHILGNHLLANGKALWWAGQFLDEPGWVRKGRGIVFSELDEQFLPDGGHFELSTMYHALALEDLLDFINLSQSAGIEGSGLDLLRKKAGEALNWLLGMKDGDGGVPLLNDSVNGGSSSCEELQDYAGRLGITPGPNGRAAVQCGPWSGENFSGYWVFRQGRFRLLFDTAPLGPDYLPGHAHCDMLGLLLDFEKDSVLVDTGVYEYEEGPRREYSRSTAGHNTVMLDGLEQAEIWKSFRMGRRGRPTGFSIDEQAISCSHTGFAMWKPGLSHTRNIFFQENGFEVVDKLKGPGHHKFQSSFHFSPGLSVNQKAEGKYLINGKLLFEISGAASSLCESDYFPEFGKSMRRPCLLAKGDFYKEAKLVIRCASCS